jgi:hypothetical protein
MTELLAELNEGVIPITEFASASNKRNSDFHEFFKTILEIVWSRVRMPVSDLA